MQYEAIVKGGEDCIARCSFFVLKSMSFVLKVMNFEFNMAGFVFKMMNFDSMMRDWVLVVRSDLAAGDGAGS